MLPRIKKKKQVTQLLKELEIILHEAIDLGIADQLTPRQMVLISSKELAKKEANEPVKKESKKPAQVITFKKRKK
jgi:hypothetical protein